MRPGELAKGREHLMVQESPAHFHPSGDKPPIPENSEATPRAHRRADHGSAPTRITRPTRDFPTPRRYKIFHRSVKNFVSARGWKISSGAGDSGWCTSMVGSPMGTRSGLRVFRDGGLIAAGVEMRRGFLHHEMLATLG